MFVTFEGPEGAGKTTAIAAIASILEKEGYRTWITREPGSGELGQAVRKILLDGIQVMPRAELFLFLADRAQHVAHEIRPALDDGIVVLCDRYADSTVVYQGYARGMDVKALRDLNRFATDNLTPDITILIDLDPEIGLKRIQDKNRLDSEPLEFHQKVRNGFLSEAKRFPERYRVVNGDRPPQVVSLEAADHILSKLKARTK